MFGSLIFQSDLPTHTHTHTHTQRPSSSSLFSLFLKHSNAGRQGLRPCSRHAHAGHLCCCRRHAEYVPLKAKRKRHKEHPLTHSLTHSLAPCLLCCLQILSALNPPDLVSPPVCTTALVGCSCPQKQTSSCRALFPLLFPPPFLLLLLLPFLPSSSSSFPSSSSSSSSPSSLPPLPPFLVFLLLLALALRRVC